MQPVGFPQVLHAECHGSGCYAKRRSALARDTSDGSRLWFWLFKSAQSREHKKLMKDRREVLRLTRLTHRDALSRLLAPWPAPISTYPMYQNSARLASCWRAMRHHLSRRLLLYRRANKDASGNHAKSRIAAVPGRKLIWRALPRTAKLACFQGHNVIRTDKELPNMRQLFGCFAGVVIGW
jgi:hypothetical protein